MALKERAQWLDLPDRSGGAVCRAEARSTSASMAAAASWSTQAVEQANVIGEHSLWGVLFTGILSTFIKMIQLSRQYQTPSLVRRAWS